MRKFASNDGGAGRKAWLDHSGVESTGSKRDHLSMNRFGLVLILAFFASLVCISHAESKEFKFRSCGDDLRRAPLDSQWNMAGADLVRSTKEIFIGTLVARSELADKGKLSIVSDAKWTIGFSWHAKHPMKYVEWTFKVQESLKGHAKPGANLAFSSLLDGTDFVDRFSNETRGFPKGSIPRIRAPGFKGLSCTGGIKFEKDKQYLIFLNSFNPFGYQEVDGADDTWAKEVRALIADQVGKK